jgi:hypothetical protein
MISSVLSDSKLSFLTAAIDPKIVQACFQSYASNWLGNDAKIAICNIRVVRHKFGKRCLIEYDVEVNHAGTSEFMTWMGKVRAKGLDRTSYQLQCKLWQQGFQSDSSDGISVPEPIGTVPEWQMWLQRKVPGTIATVLLPNAEGNTLAQRIAAALCKLHRTQILPDRHHGIEQELAILHDRLDRVAQQFPQWQRRLERILNECDRTAGRIESPHVCGIHRDFYPDQVLINDSRLYLLDFDLYTTGDPGLDAGNFNGHLIEQGLRSFHDPAVLASQQTAFTEQFIHQSGAAVLDSVETYTTLTLVRHIYLSTQFPDRQPFTEQLLELCEQRLLHPKFRYF